MRLQIAFIFVLFLCAIPAHAQCVGPAQSAVQTAYNSASPGATITLCQGSATYSGFVVSGKAITFSGATVCAGSGNPAANNLTCADNSGTCSSVGTCITVTSNAGFNEIVTATNFVTTTGITFIMNGSFNNGGVLIEGPGNAVEQVGFHFHHNHIIMPTSGSVAIEEAMTFGLNDHLYIQDTTTSGPIAIPFNFGGDFATRGYIDWNQATQLGTNQAMYLEDSYYVSSNPSLSTECMYDAYFGAKIVVRYNTIIGNCIGGSHGTDSGQFRSVIAQEIYGNSISNSTGTVVPVFNELRGGTLLFWSNTVGGSTTWQAINPAYFRITQQIVSQVGTWGSAGTGLNWVPLSADSTNVNSDVNTLNGADWQASHSYSAGAFISPTTAASNYQVSGSCTSSGSRPTFNTGIPSTTSDGSCSWSNVGGSSTAGLTVAGWCALNPDTLAASNTPCNALSSGDTASRYFDANGGVYPFRDQPGRVHNQVLAPVWEWINGGSGLPNPTIDITLCGSACVANRDYGTYTTSFTGTSGVGSGALSARPSTCTPNVAYWDTTNNQLDACFTTNTWTVYYTPYTYPDPLNNTVVIPTFSPLGGTYSGTQTVTISTTTPGATICWTNDGSTPTANNAGTCTHGTTLIGTISVASTQVLKAIGSKSGFSDSGVGSASYTIGPPPLTAPSQAMFSKMYSAQPGNWIGVYGVDGYALAASTQNLPAYATFTPSGTSLYTWAASTSDPRALQVGSSRIAACWYSGTSESFSVSLTDGKMHTVTLYALDWDLNGRVETINVTNAATGALLDSRTISAFSNGLYITWNCMGNVKFTIVRDSGANSVISGVFFG